MQRFTFSKWVHVLFFLKASFLLHYCIIICSHVFSSNRCWNNNAVSDRALDKPTFEPRDWHTALRWGRNPSLSHGTTSLVEAAPQGPRRGLLGPLLWSLRARKNEKIEGNQEKDIHMEKHVIYGRVNCCPVLEGQQIWVIWHFFWIGVKPPCCTHLGFAFMSFRLTRRFKFHVGASTNWIWTTQSFSTLSNRE